MAQRYKNKRKNRIWTNELIIERALKFKDRGTFAKEDSRAYTAAHVRGKEFLDFVCAHMTPLRKIWSEETVLNIGSQCKNQTEMIKLYLGAYKYAYRNNLLDKINFKEKKKIIKWTNEEILEKALLCRTRSEFERQFLGMYKASIKRNIHEQVCFHMEKDVGFSNPEKEIFEYVKKYMPTCKKLRVRKIKIFKKPWVYGFDIDIFIPELKKGIEFDGTYHHSFEGLKRGHPLWPDEDIRNYHKLKDDYFASKGIQVLHIKEEDWIKNKKECEIKIINFLNEHI